VRRQDGMTLIVVLVMLVVITLLAIAGMRMTNSSLLVVGNMQARKFVENNSLQIIEQMMSSIGPFNTPTTTFTCSSAAAGPDPQVLYGMANGITCNVTARTCQFSAPASGYSATSTVAPEDNIWEFDVTVDDTITGAHSKMKQGAKIRQLAGSCT
jgi:Tfp pilus assembly protein PilX